MGTVAADDGDEIALVHTQIDETKRKIVYLALHILPCPGLPDTEFFFAVSGLVPEPLRVPLQQRRNGHKPTGRL